MHYIGAGTNLGGLVLVPDLNLVHTKPFKNAACRAGTVGTMFLSMT